MPDAWLTGSGRPWHHRASPNKFTARELGTRAPTATEQPYIEMIQQHFLKSSSKVILLGDGDKIALLQTKRPVVENDLLLSASVDKTITSLSAGVAICSGKISLTTKAKDVLPELAGTFIGETTLKDNLTMSSGTTTAFLDQQSLNAQEESDVQNGRKSFMDFMKGRWAIQQDQIIPGTVFDYKSQDPMLVSMMISAAYGRKDGKNFREWQEEHFFPLLKLKDQRVQGKDHFGYGWADGNTRMTVRDWARLAVFVLEKRKQNDCYGKYIREASSTQIKNEFHRSKHFMKGYGYLIWTDLVPVPNSYMAAGYGGQLIVWSTVNDKYVVIFSNNENIVTLGPMIHLWLDSK